MTYQPDAHNVLAQVREGMAVYDAANERIGVVRDVFMGGGGVDPAERRRQLADQARRSDDTADTDDAYTGGVPEVLAPSVTSSGETAGPLGDRLLDAFTPSDGPAADEARLQRERSGYLQIDSAGFFASDRYATLDQIAQVSGDRVMLSVGRDALAKA